jgi:hypothetical protein
MALPVRTGLEDGVGGIVWTAVGAYDSAGLGPPDRPQCWMPDAVVVANVALVIPARRSLRIGRGSSRMGRGAWHGAREDEHARWFWRP